MGKEERLLLLCSRVDLQEKDIQNLRELSCSGLDWEYISKIAAYHRVLPLLYHNIKKYIPNDPPADVGNCLKEMLMRNSAKNLFMLSWLISITDLLKAHGIQALTFKGPVLAEKIYGNIGFRSFGDLDLLIPRTDLQKAVSLLLEQGFVQDIDLSPEQYGKLINKSHHAVLVKDSVVIELHWELSGRYFLRNVYLESLLPRAEEVDLAGHRLQTFGSEDLLLYLCIHGCRHQWFQLDAVCCVAELVKKKTDLDWEQVWMIARRLGALKMVVLGLLLAKELLGVVLPGKVEAKMDEFPKLMEIADDIAGGMMSSTGVSERQMSYWKYIAFHHGIMDNHLDWLRYCLKSLLNPTHSDWLWIRLPASLSVFYYVFRPLRLFAKYSSKLLK